MWGRALARPGRAKARPHIVPMKRREKIEGALWCLLIGDALGVPYEFQRWRNGLRDTELFKPLLTELITRPSP
jgi:hypothetical protein